MPMMNAMRAPRFAAEGFAPDLVHHIFLVAIRGEPPLPMQHSGGALHPVQVILTGPGDMPSLAGIEAAIGPLPALPPHRQLVRAARGTSLAPREVTGEILRDGRGRLYEKVGDQVRPINRLFSGARGEVIDLAPLADAGAPGGGDIGGDDGGAGEGFAEDAAAADEGRHRSLRELVRGLVPEPGIWRLVRFADFMDVLAPQLASPARLQPGHQLACYIQIHEAIVSVPLAALEQAAARELGACGRMLPLSYELCRRFALSLPRPAFGVATSRQPVGAGCAPAGARFVTLRIAVDPTATVAAPIPPPPAQPAAAPPQPHPETTALKTAIPDGFTCAANLRISRDEAIYDMTLATTRSAWRRFIDRLAHGVSGGAMRKWHALLLGKSAEEQLWGIRPPRGGLEDGRVRRWAEHALRLAGYELPRMLAEWEIHWRRQGF